jgi:hypothetical protein
MLNKLNTWEYDIFTNDQFKVNPNTAVFIAARVSKSSKSPQQLAKELGLGNADNISKIISGTTKLPIAKVGMFAKALDVDPVELLMMCLEEYYPATWESVSPFLDTVLTCDELSIVKALRSAVGGPYVMALTPEERQPLNDFIHLLRRPTLVH